MATVPRSKLVPPKSYVDYLQDVAGESHELDDDDGENRRLDASPVSLGMTFTAGAADATATDSSQHTRATPLRSRGSGLRSGSGMHSPQTTEARSFVDGLLSPFSPLLHQQQGPGGNENPCREEFLESVSLQPCHKVSVVVRVLPCNEAEERCLFPHIKRNDGDGVVQKPKSPYDMVVVKPSAFGKFIPSQVTMEVAELVAQVAHISSEDWARLYEFHHVMWPDAQLKMQHQENQEHQRDQPGQNEHFTTMDSLSQAVVQDALMERQSSVFISLGQAPTCIQPLANQDSSCLLPKIITHCQRLMAPKVVATISMVELQEEKDTFRDLLNRKNKTISIRHHDMKGAVLEGVTQVRLDNIDDLLSTIQIQKQKQKNIIVATISIWDNAVSQDLKRAPDSEIMFVELARADPEKTPSKSRSTVSLGLALRQLLIHSSLGTDPAISYRESTITKVLQRSLESSKIVLIASVSQRSQDYEATLATLNFLRRLLVKPGKTASSPFDAKHHLQDATTDIAYDIPVSSSTTDQLQRYANDESLLAQIIADPRQRLAKIFKKSPARSTQAEIQTESVGSVDEYYPIDYMQGLDAEIVWESPTSPLEEAREPSTSRPTPQMIALEDEEPEEVWRMEEPQEKSGDYASSPMSSSVSMEGNNIPSISSSRQEVAHQYQPPIHEKNPFVFSGVSQVIDQNEYEQSWSFCQIQHELMKLSLRQVEDGDENLLEGVIGEIVEREDSGEGNSQNISEEIVFINQDDMGPYRCSMDEPRSSFELLAQGDPNEESYQKSHTAFGSGRVIEPFENEASNQVFSMDDSLPSGGGSRSSYLFQESRSLTNTPSPVEDGGSQLTPPSRHEESECLQNSAFQSVSSRMKSHEDHYIIRQPASHEKLNGKGADQYLDDIRVLEGAVQQIQSMQSGLWRSSEQSLTKVRDLLTSQRQEMTFLSEEREMLSKTVSELKDEIQKCSEEQDHRLQRYEEEVQHLEHQLQYALSERKKLKTMVDEATFARNEMLVANSNIESQLGITRKEVLTIKESYQSVLTCQGELEAEARQAKKELDELKGYKEAMDRTCARLQHSLEITEEENTALTRGNISKDNAIRDLTNRVEDNEKKQQELHTKLLQIETLRRQEAFQFEKLNFSNKSLSSSLEEILKEKSALEEGRRRDKAVIEKLQTEIRDTIISCNHHDTQKLTMEAKMKEIELKLAITKDEAAAREISLTRFKERCQHLEARNSQDGSEKDYWEEQCQKESRVVARLEEEIRKLTSERNSDEAKIRQLEDRLCSEESRNLLENERFREKYTQSEKEKEELESLVTRHETEYFDEFQKKTREIIDCQNRADEFEHQVRILKQHEMEYLSMKDTEISLLNREVETNVEKLDALNRKGLDLELQVRSLEERLITKNEDMERCRSERHRAEVELNTAREKEKESSDIHGHNLNRRIKELEGDIAHLAQDRERSSRKSEEESSANRHLTLELDRTRLALSAANKDLRRLERHLKDSESERLVHERKLSTMKTAVHQLQFNTRESFELLVNEQKDLTKLTESLQEERDKLRLKLLKTRRERDACRHCLDFGREKLSQLFSKDGGGGFLEALTNGPLAAVKNDTAVGSASRRLSTELYLTEHPVDRLFAPRAEEIATCLAVSAKASLQDSQNENSKLRSRMYSLEEERKAEVSALQMRIKFLEQEAQTTYRLM